MSINKKDNFSISSDRLDEQGRLICYRETATGEAVLCLKRIYFSSEDLSLKINSSAFQVYESSVSNICNFCSKCKGDTFPGEVAMFEKALQLPEHKESRSDSMFNNLYMAADGIIRSYPYTYRNNWVISRFSLLIPFFKDLLATMPERQEEFYKKVLKKEQYTPILFLYKAPSGFPLETKLATIILNVARNITPEEWFQFEHKGLSPLLKYYWAKKEKEKDDARWNKKPRGRKAGK